MTLNIIVLYFEFNPSGNRLICGNFFLYNINVFFCVMAYYLDNEGLEL